MPPSPRPTATSAYRQVSRTGDVPIASQNVHYNLQLCKILFKVSFTPGAQGDAHLRYSREPVSLFKDGVLMYAKPDRSQWREGKSLSGAS